MDQELKTEFQTAFAEFRQALERQDGELKSAGSVSSETKTAVDRINERLGELETKMARAANKLGGEGGAPEAPKASEAKNALFAYARKGEVSPEERKMLTVSDDTTGGYLAPTEYVKEILKEVVEWSPLRQYARVRSTTQRSIQQPRKTGTFAARWATETGQRTETDGLRYGLEEIPTHEMVAMVDISNQDLEDSAFDLESELRTEFGEQFGVTEGAAFVLGNGVGKPQGALGHQSIAETKTGDATKITADSVISLAYDVKEFYARNGMYFLNRQTLKQIRLLKDANGVYIWQPGLASGEPATINGKPYVEVIDMPDIAANSTPVIFGDMRKALTIVDRLAISILRDPYTQATSNAVRFLARKRVGSQVLMAEAIRKLRVAA